MQPPSKATGEALRCWRREGEGGFKGKEDRPAPGNHPCARETEGARGRTMKGLMVAEGRREEQQVTGSPGQWKGPQPCPEGGAWWILAEQRTVSGSLYPRSEHSWHEKSTKLATRKLSPSCRWDSDQSGLQASPHRGAVECGAHEGPSDPDARPSCESLQPPWFVSGASGEAREQSEAKGETRARGVRAWRRRPCDTQQRVTQAVFFQRGSRKRPRPHSTCIEWRLHGVAGFGSCPLS